MINVRKYSSKPKKYFRAVRWTSLKFERLQNTQPKYTRVFINNGSQKLSQIQRKQLSLRCQCRDVVRIFQRKIFFLLKIVNSKNCVQDIFSISVFEFDEDAWKCCNLKIIHNTWLLDVLNYRITENVQKKAHWVTD